MRTVLLSLVLALGALSTNVSEAQQVVPVIVPIGAPEIDVKEVLRHGNMVQIIDSNIQSYGDDAAVDAIGPPADDNDKWFVSVIGTADCGACNKLKADWKVDPSLQAVAMPSDPTNSWAHLNFYDYADASQKARWVNVKFRGFPTILIQPPLNGKFGPPSAPVAHILGYGGDGRKLALTITSCIKKFVMEGSQNNQSGFRNSNDFGVEPPFNPPSKNPQPSITPGVTFPQTIYPADKPAVPAPVVDGPSNVWFIVAMVMLGGLSLVFVVIGLIGLSSYLRSRKVAQKAADRADMMSLVRTMMESSTDKKAV